jgi:tRNA threonylcarbamoyladenosine modification (KEOPS) complex  Pcc1 subunit
MILSLIIYGSLKSELEFKEGKKYMLLEKNHSPLRLQVSALDENGLRVDLYGFG